jgi:hypothetical protein
VRARSKSRPTRLDLALQQILTGTGGQFPGAGRFLGLDSPLDLLYSVVRPFLDNPYARNTAKLELEALFRALQPQQPDSHGGPRPGPVPEPPRGLQERILNRFERTSGEDPLFLAGSLGSQASQSARESESKFAEGYARVE